MKKSIVIKVALLLVVLGIAWACSDSFLDLKPQGSISQADLSNKVGAEAALVGAYSMLDGYNIDNNNTWPADPVNWIFGSITTDDAYKGSEQTDGPENTQLEIYQWSPGNVQLDTKWVPLYEGVVRSNNVFKLVAAATDISQADQDRIKGEAEFLRGYYHFELYKVWGAIPYFREDDTDFKKGNADGDAAALNNCIADLEAAVSLLPATQADRGRVTKKAAQAFLGKLYCFAGRWSDAKAVLDPVVNSTSLAPCQRDLWTYATENDEEALLSVQMSVSSAAQARNSNWLDQLAYPVSGGFGCCGFHQPSQNLVNAYKVNASGLPMMDPTTGADLSNAVDLDPATDTVDPRLDLTVGRDNVPYWDWAVHNPSFIRSRSFSGPFSPKKFTPYKVDPVPGGGWNGASNNGENVPIIRLADAILLLAEAEVNLGNLDRAQQLVNMIRARAGNCAQGPMTDASSNPLTGYAVVDSDIHDPAITWATYDVQQYPAGTFTAKGAAWAMDAVIFERRLELALEGHRLFDLRRWGIAPQVLNAFVAVEKTKRTYYAAAETYGAKHRWFPIPTIEIELSKVNGTPTLVQNPGY